MPKRKIDYKVIFDEYNEKKLRCTEIRKKYNISQTSVYRAIHFYLPKICIADGPSKMLTKEFLEEHYVKQKKCMSWIAKEFGIKDPSSVRRALKKYNIPIQNNRRMIRARDVPGTKNWKGCGDISGSFFSQIKSKARRRKIKYDEDITIEYLWELFLKQNKKCALSGQNLCFRYKETERRVGQTASLDRIDSKKHYSRDNIQWIHKDLQPMKMNKSQESFLEWCYDIVKYNNVQHGKTEEIKNMSLSNI